MHNKSNILTAVSVILALALVLVGAFSFNSFQKVKDLKADISKIEENNEVLKSENDKLKEENNSAKESLKAKEETIEKYQNILAIKEGDLDKISSNSAAYAKQVKELKATIENNKVTIDKLKKEIEELKTQVDPNKAEIKRLELALKAATDSDKLTHERLDTVLDKVENVLVDVRSKIDNNKDNEEIVKVLKEIEANLDAVMNVDLGE